MTLARDHDWVRRALMFEPRGHDVMSGVILYPPVREDCDVGFLFIEVSGCLPMCGHGTIGAVTTILEEGLVVPRAEGRLAIDTPAGRVEVEYTRNGPFIEQVRLFNVASYLHTSDVELQVPGLGALKVDLAYGGNYYVIIEPQANWPGLDGMSAAQILALSPLVRRAADEKLSPAHPEDPCIRGVSHVMWCDRPRTRARMHAMRCSTGIRRSTDRHAVLDPRPEWRNSPPRPGSPRGPSSFTRASSARCSTAASNRRHGWGPLPRSARAWQVGPASLDTIRFLSTIAIRWRTAFRSHSPANQ